MKRLLVEGWRTINHSYAMVNQYQLLQLRQLPIELRHRDLPLLQEQWNAATNGGGFDAARREAILSVPPPELPDSTYDAIFRIGFPYRYQPAASRRLYVFGTSEAQAILPGQVLDDDFHDARQNAATCVVTPSRWSRIGFLKAGFPEERVLVIPHGIDPQIHRRRSAEERQAFRQALKLRDDEFVILSLGAMTWNKGIDALLLGYAALKQRYPQLRLILKDQSALYGLYAQDILRELMDQHPGRFDQQTIASISFLSANLNLDLLGGLYNAVDCYAAPYRAEGFNLPPLEAAATGTPIVVTAGGSTDDYAHPSFALKVEARLAQRDEKTFLEPDVDSLIEQLSALIEGRCPELDAAIAAERIGRDFSWSAVTARLAEAMLG